MRLYQRILATEENRLTQFGRALYMFLTSACPETGGVIPMHSTFWVAFLNCPAPRKALREALRKVAGRDGDPPERLRALWLDPDFTTIVAGFAQAWKETQPENRSGHALASRHELQDEAGAMAQGVDPTLDWLIREADRKAAQEDIRAGLREILERVLKQRGKDRMRLDALVELLRGVPAESWVLLIRRHLRGERQRSRRLRAVLVNARGLRLADIAKGLGVERRTFYRSVEAALTMLASSELHGRRGCPGPKPRRTPTTRRRPSGRRRASRSLPGR